MFVENFESYVNLGCSLEEQSSLQPVLLSVRINFYTSVGGEKSDQLSDAVDYAELCKKMDATATQKPYQLIEHMAYECMQTLLPLLKQFSGTLSVTVKKIRVPIKQLQGGVQWTCQTQF